MADEDKKTLSARNTKSTCVDHFEGDSLLLKSLLSIRPDKPCHKIQESLFSSSGYVDYSGIVNFSLILMVLSNAHIALESIATNGILYDPVEVLKIGFYSTIETLSGLIGLNIFALCSFGIEVLLSKGLLSEKFGLMIIITLLTSEIVIPSTALYFTDCHFTVAHVVACFAAFLFMKLVSYHITNAWCRESEARTQKAQKLSALPGNGKRKDTENDNAETNLVRYPENLNIKDFYYFLYAPTLCYELNFPRSARIRRMFLVKRVLEMIILTQINLFLIQQCILPTFNETLKPLQEMDYSSILEKYFKFSVPYVSTLLIAFYSFYHCFLNALAESLRFGDRYFYCDFWNSGTIMDFWQKWAVPVHKFSLRHIYLPLRQRGFSHYQTLTAFFFASAALHEYVFGVTIKMFRFWSFLLMLVQVPYFMFLDKWLDEKYGNMVVITFFLIALPFYNLMYYHDYYMGNYQNIEATA